MAENNMFLKKKWFMLGNLAPDMILSFIIIPHKYSLTAPYVSRLSVKLLNAKRKYRPIMMSFYLGVIAHFICDYFCYTHSELYKGGMRHHFMHEKKQELKKENLFVFFKNKSMKIDRETLAKKFHKYIAQWESMLCQNMDISENDMEFAIYIATWFTSSVYCLSNKLEGEKTDDENLCTRHQCADTSSLCAAEL